MPLLPPKSSSNSPGRISQSAFSKISCRSFPSGSTDHISVKFADFFKGRLCVWHLFLLQINHWFPEGRNQTLFCFLSPGSHVVPDMSERSMRWRYKWSGREEIACWDAPYDPKGVFPKLRSWRFGGRSPELKKVGGKRRKQLCQQMLKNFWGSYSCCQNMKPPTTRTSVPRSFFPCNVALFATCDQCSDSPPKGRLQHGESASQDASRPRENVEAQRGPLPGQELGASPPLLSPPCRWILCLGTGKIWIYVHKRMHEAKGAEKM